LNSIERGLNSGALPRPAGEGWGEGAVISFKLFIVYAAQAKLPAPHKQYSIKNLLSIFYFSVQEADFALCRKKGD